MKPQYSQNTDNSDIVIDPGDLFYRCWHNLPIIIAVTLACAIIAYAATAVLIQPTYSASADMIVNNNQQESTTITNSDLQASSTLVGTYSIVLKSHVVLERVIDELGLPYDYDTLESNISIKAVDNTQVMRITVKDTSPEQALRIVSAIVAAAPEAIMNTIEAGSVKTVDDPWTSGEPVSPNRLRNIVIGGLIGLVVCFVVILCRMLLNNKFKSQADIREVLDLPVLAVIPLERKGKG